MSSHKLMADKLGTDDEEEDVLAPKEPQVTSDKPEERKAARALRIKKRQDALKRMDQLPDEGAMAIQDEAPGPIEQATAAAAEELQRLSLEGNAKVTNVKVYSDEREVHRRFKAIEKNNEFMQLLEQDATEAQIKYEAISGKWESILELQDPLDIDTDIQAQRAKCNLLMQQKNQLIQQLKDELTKTDQAYCDDLEKQDQDIRELSDRIQRQVTIMQRAYEQQLFLIETAISAERSSMVEYNQKRWDALYKQRDREELGQLEFKFQQSEDLAIEMDAIDWEHIEKYRTAKMQLEELIQDLQKELEKLKAICLINGEKIGYNYQVLKKREEENLFVRSQQKRKLNKMADVMNALRAKIRKAADDGAIEESKGDIEIAKMKQAMTDLENKSAHFAQVADYKLQQTWRMNALHCNELVRNLRRCEVALHAQVLAQPPPPPPPPPPHSPLRPAVSSKKVDNVVSSVEIMDENNTAAIEAKENLVKHILSLVADNSGFLVENRLHELLENYPKSSKNLCSLDAILMALEIRREEDIALLCKTFLEYAFCPICIGMDDLSAESDQANEASQVGSQYSRSMDRTRISHVTEHSDRGGRSMMTRSLSPSTSRSFRSGFDPKLSECDQVLMMEAGQILKQYEGPIGVEMTGAPMASDKESSGPVQRRARGVTVADAHSQPAETSPTLNPFLCPVGHTLEIEPMQVLAALGDFVTTFCPPEKERLNQILESVKPRDMSTPSRLLTAREVEEYWGKFHAMFPEAKDKLWTGLLDGLNAYLPMLQERERLHSEVQELRRKNRGLRTLIRGSLPALPSASRRAPPSYLRASPVAFTATLALPSIL